MTPEQRETLLAAVRQEWLANGLATGPADQQAAERGVAEAYRAAGLPPPRRVVWLGSPFTGAVCAWMLEQFDSNGQQDRPWQPVQDLVCHQIVNQVWDQIETPVQHPIEDQGRDHIGEQIARLSSQVENQNFWLQLPIDAQIWAQTSQHKNWIENREPWGFFNECSEPPEVLAWILAEQAEILARIWAEVWERIETPMPGPVWDQIWAQTWPPLQAVTDEARARARTEVVTRIWAAVREQLGSEGRAQVEREFDLPLERRLGLQRWQESIIEFPTPCYGQHHETGALAYFDTFRRLGVDGCGRLAGLMTVARNAGWWWPLRDVAILTERPVELHHDDHGRPHHPTGPAIGYPDGFTVHAWHGVRVDEWIITGELTAADWLMWGRGNDMNVRWAVADRIGYQRLLDELPADRRHTDESGTLWRIPHPHSNPHRPGGDMDIWLVEVIDTEPDGSHQRRVLRVPPSLPTAHAAVAWTVDQSPETYQSPGTFHPATPT